MVGPLGDRYVAHRIGAVRWLRRLGRHGDDAAAARRYPDGHANRDATRRPRPATPAGGTAADAANARAAELQEDAAPGVVIVVGIEWAFGTGLASIAAGEVTFDMINEGAVVHDIWVLRTEHAYDALPVEGGVAVTGGDVEVVQKVLETPSGTTVSLTANLEPGTYALICNIPAHYQLGMRAPFTID